MEAMRGLMAKSGLTVNEKKTRPAKLPDETFDFPGYTVVWVVSMDAVAARTGVLARPGNRSNG
jgi:hypothetical protein